MLKDRINEDIKSAMKAKNMFRLNVVRSIKDALHKAEIDNIGTYSEAIENKVIKKMIASHKDSIEQFKGREDLVANETAELAIIQEYAPEEVSEDVIIHYTENLILNFKLANGSVSMKDMKPILSEVQNKYPNADGKLVSTVLKGFLK